MGNQKTLIFFHIQRTAGTTLDMIIRRHFKPNASVQLDVNQDPQCVGKFIHLPEKERGEVRYLEGHMPFGLHNYLPCSSAYITLLRDPVDRAISEYYGITRGLQDSLHRFNSDSRATSNWQTRCISGLQWGDLLDGFSPAPDNILEVAKANLQKHFLLVGLTDRLDEFLILLKKAFGWKIKDILYTRQKVRRRPRRPRKNEISNETAKLIAERNQLDIQLYEFAKRKFEERIRQQGFLFKWELLILRLCNLHNTAYDYLMKTKLEKIVDLLPALIRKDISIPYIFNKVWERGIKWLQKPT